MAVKPRQQRHPFLDGSPEAAESGLAALAAGSRALTEAATLDEALSAIAAGTARAAAADVVVVRVRDADDRLRVRAVQASSAALAAELEGSRFPVDQLPLEEVDDLAAFPAALRQTAQRAGATAVLLVPIVLDGGPAGSLELLRAARAFAGAERLLARLAAAQIGLAVRAFDADGSGRTASAHAEVQLERAGEALAAGSDEARTEEAVPRLAAEATAARAALLWRRAEDGPLGLVATYGLGGGAEEGLEVAGRAAARALQGRRPVAVEEVRGLPAGAGVSATLQLGQPAIGGLQVLFAAGEAPEGPTLARLATFGVRSAHALRASERTRAIGAELERTRALLDVLGQAIEHLSLAHTLETAVEQVSQLLGTDRLAVYLLEDGRLTAAAGLGLAGPHVRVGERLLELGLAGARGRGVVVVDDAAQDPRLGPVRQAVLESGIEAAIVAPLFGHEGPIGLLAAYPPRGRALGADEGTLLTALTTQLAVAVQNAQLHERTKQLGAEREEALVAERRSAKQLGALYEITRSFAFEEEVSLQKTVDTIVRTVAELLELDAAVIRMLDERREQLVVRALYVSDPRLEQALRPLIERPQPLDAATARRAFGKGEPLFLDPERADSLGAGYALLVPFLRKGSTVAVLPIATSTEVLATLSLISLDPGRPLGTEAVETALVVARQAALVIDNARLYQQRKDFADTMQRSLLPRSAPELPGLELGDVYESSARLEVGGDVYDYLTLDDGRLAVVLGDVTGHGIDATADMAMAKFAFRSLARDNPEPGAFLAAANEVVVDEVATGKFITMAYLTADAETGEVACACAGHPAPRLVGAGGTVEALATRGLALGIDDGQSYDEVRATLEPGGSVVLYTDGVLEARRDGELYGSERLDRLLAKRHALPARELARAVLADCRAFSGGELRDDCAIVVIRRR